MKKVVLHSGETWIAVLYSLVKNCCIQLRKMKMKIRDF